MKKFLFLLVLIPAWQFIQAQDRSMLMQHPDYALFVKDTVFNVPRYVQFYEFNQPSFVDWKRVLTDLYKTGPETDWKIIREESDRIGMHHVFVQQRHSGIPVEGAVMAIHARSDKIASISGTFLPISKQNILIGMGPEKAVSRALALYPATKYKWQIAEEELFIKETNQDTLASWFPTATLVYVANQFDLQPGKISAAYKMKIYAEEPHFARQVYLDAQSGQLLAEEDLIQIINRPGTAVTRYSDTQSMVTDSFTGGYRLRETGRGNGIETFNLKKGSSYGAAVDFTDSDNFWDNANANKDEIATDAHWGAEMTYDYFFSKFGRNSFDNKGAKIRSYVHYGNNYNNAFWNGSVMTYGDGDGSVFTPLTSMDVCGHEVSHAVTTNTAGLIYSYESGALNESFSDIFGNSIEKYAKPNDFNWRMGEEITPSGNGIRHMGNPNAKGHPDTYKGTLWYSGAGDNGGVHSNSGVQNYWYYLLCEGGIGKNDKSDSFFVDSLGMEKAEQIAYRNLSVYLTPNSQYADARFFSIQSAIDLYGNCSPEVIATTNAWHAVGVGQRYDSGSIKVDFTVDTFFCRAPVFVPFFNRSINTNKYKWKFGDGQTTVSENPVHQYLQQGIYTVTLEGEGCFVNLRDTVIKTNVIVIDSTPDICNSVRMPKGRWETVSVCRGFVYDNGGEDKYAHLIKDTLTLSPSNCDSVSLRFLDFDYENKYDSVYIYNGPTPAFPKIGGYTGSTLPKGGNPIVSSGGSLTLIHFSDPLVNGRGFKAEIKVFTKPLDLKAMPDSTVCYNQPLALYVHPRGGSPADYLYVWNGQMRHDSILNISLIKDSTFTVELVDVCSDLRDTVTFNIKVRAPLSISVSKDTTVCYGSVAKIYAKTNGGKSDAYQYFWNGVAGSDSVVLTCSSDSLFKVSVLDNCTPQNDTNQVWVLVLPPLKVDLNADTILCSGAPVSLIAQGKGGKGLFTYSWSGGLGNGQSKVVTPSAHNTFSVTVSDGCTQPSISDSVRVWVRDPLLLTLPKDTQICLGQSLVIKPNISGGDTLNRKLLWNQTQTLDSAMLVPQNDTILVVKLQDNCSTVEPIDTINIWVYDPLTVSLPLDDTLCVGQSKSLLATPGGGRNSTYTYSWNPLVGLGPSVLVNPIVTTQYKVVLSDGCTQMKDTATITLFVREPLKVVASSNATICQGDTVRLSAVGTGGLGSVRNYSWSPAGLNMQNADVSPLSSTLYVVTFNDGCSDYALDTILVTVKPSPKIDFYVQSSPACAGEPLLFNNLTTSSSSDVFRWDFGDGNSSTVKHPVHVYNSGGWHRIELRATNDQACTKIKGFDSLVEILPMPIPAFDMNGSVIPFDNPILTLSNRSQNATSYSWDFGDGATSTDIDPTHRYADSGHVTVKLTAYNRIGCDSSLEQKLWVKPTIVFHLPNAFSPADANGANDVFKPVFTAITEYRMLIFNRWGEVLFESTNPQKGWDGKDSDGDYLPQGNYNYFIHVINIDNVSQVYKGNVLLIR